MKKQVLALTTLNSVALLGIGAYVLVGGDEPLPGASSGAPEQTSSQVAGVGSGSAGSVASLERRVAELERRLAARPNGVAGDAPIQRPDGDSESLATVSPEGAVERSELGALVRAEVRAMRQEEKTQYAKAAARPKKALGEVSRELALDPQQEDAIRGLYEQLERASIQTLFEVGEDALPQLKLQIAQAEHDPALKQALRDRIAVNWTKHQTSFSVMWVQLDQQLRKILPPETVAKFYKYEVHLDDREFPDIRALFFSEEEQQ